MIFFFGHVHPGEIVTDDLVKKPVKSWIVPKENVSRSAKKRLVVSENRYPASGRVKMKAGEGKHNSEQFLLNNGIVLFRGTEAPCCIRNRPIILQQHCTKTRGAGVRSHLQGTQVVQIT